MNSGSSRSSTSGLSGAEPGHPVVTPERGTYERTVHAAWLYNHWRAVPILTTGGVAPENPQAAPLSGLMRQILIANGVPETMIWTESGSSSTYENALLSARILWYKLRGYI